MMLKRLGYIETVSEMKLDIASKICSI